MKTAKEVEEAEAPHRLQKFKFESGSFFSHSQYTIITNKEEKTIQGICILEGNGFTLEEVGKFSYIVINYIRNFLRISTLM